MNRRDLPHRTAFTLIELLIVLSILAVVLAFSWPAVGGLLAKNQLRGAARQVRAALAKTRLEALESGTVLQFQYQPGTGRFRIGPQASPAATDEAPAAIDAAAVPVRMLERTLASGVRFAPPVAGDQAADPMASGELSPEAWSAPILFFPNGRVTHARLQLQGPREFRVQLTLRGATGAVSVGDLQRAGASP